MEYEISEGYFDWLCSIVNSDTYAVDDFSKVLWKLYTTAFTPIIRNDQNRIAEALYFRTRYSTEDLGPVSILELMVSMAVIIEERIMANTSSENRTADWFWDMMQCIGLSQDFDDIYNEGYVDKVIDDFIERKYDRNGLGSLFVTRDPAIDMRKTELWYQMQYHFKDILEDEGFLSMKGETK